MKSPELLAPAGNMNSLKAAMMAGCDAVYIGGKLFGARNYANNFNDEEIIEAINYAHLYGVKIYVTVNTLIYEKEVDLFINYVEFLYKNNVDALIIQDIGMMDLIRKKFPDLELHASTQMHIHNLEGVKLVQSLGLKRVVLARETSIDTIKIIKEKTNIELEIFIHGSLCVSYSGECLMSSLIGNRSGNRGSCAGVCRQLYSLENEYSKIENKYLLSTKDLCTLEHIGSLINIGVDSLKIEGRMKSPSYVYMVTKLYRKAIDSYINTGKVEIDSSDLNNLKKIFNREFTKGFLFNEDNNKFTNDFRPNHLGVNIGKVIGVKNNMVSVKLTDKVNNQDGIRIIGKNDYGCTITNVKDDVITINTKENFNIGDTVVKTSDYLLNKQIEQLLKGKRKVDIQGKLTAIINKPLMLELTDKVNCVKVIGSVVEKSINSPIAKERIELQIKKLGNSIYSLSDLKLDLDDNIFISIKELNDLKNNAIDLLNNKRLYINNYNKQKYNIDLSDYIKENNINIYIENNKYYEAIKSLKLNTIYSEELINDKRFILKLDRVINNYKEYNESLLVGELGSVYKYKNISTDFSLNVTNSYAVALLHSLGVKKITLSYELDYNQIKDIVESYEKRYNKHPNLEVVIFGREEAMISKFNLNKRYKMDNTCLVDRFNNRYPIIIKNDLMHIYNYKVRNLQEDYFKIGINNIRYNIIVEDDLKLFLKTNSKILGGNYE